MSEPLALIMEHVLYIDIKLGFLFLKPTYDTIKYHLEYWIEYGGIECMNYHSNQNSTFSLPLVQRIGRKKIVRVLHCRWVLHTCFVSLVVAFIFCDKTSKGELVIQNKKQKYFQWILKATSGDTSLIYNFWSPKLRILVLGERASHIRGV